MALAIAAEPTSWLTRLPGLWPLWLPLLLGGAAIFWLLPRPRAYPVYWGVLAGVAALLLAGGLLVQTGDIENPETILFYAFSGISVTAGALLVTQRNPARAALSFALVVLSSCGLFMLMAAPFLMAATIIIYAGAIVVTFLFVLMLAQQEGLSNADARSREPLLATITGFALLATLLYTLHRAHDPLPFAEFIAEIDAHSEPAALQKLWDEHDKTDLDKSPWTELRSRMSKALGDHGWTDLQSSMENSGVKKNTAEEMARSLGAMRAIAVEARGRLTPPPPGDTNKRRPTLSTYSGASPTAPAEDRRRDPKTGLPALPAENAAYLGRSLFTDYLLPVELGGTLLLVATVGAIAIAQRRSKPRRDSALPPPSSNGRQEAKA